MVNATTKVVNSANDNIVKPVINNAEPIASSAVKPVGSLINNAQPIASATSAAAVAAADAKRKAAAEASRKAAAEAKRKAEAKKAKTGKK